MPDQVNNEGGDGGTPEPMGAEQVIVRLDVPYSELAPEVQSQYMMAVANCVGAMMPPGPDPAGRALFFLLIPDVDQSGKLPYVTNADARSLAPSLRHLAARFAGPNPDQLAATETVVEALRRASDAMEGFNTLIAGWRDNLAQGNAEFPDGAEAACREYDAARSHAMEVLDALAPDVVAPKVEIQFQADTKQVRDAIEKVKREESDHAQETVPPGTTGDDHDRRSDLHGKGVRPGTDDAPARPGRRDPEPFRPHPPGDAV